jgi:hypothetical protein
MEGIELKMKLFLKEKSIDLSYSAVKAAAGKVIMEALL